MKKENNIHLKDGQEIPLPPNMERVKNTDAVRIPILDKFYEVDGELYYEVSGDSTPRKWKDYSHMNFN